MSWYALTRNLQQRDTRPLHLRWQSHNFPYRAPLSSTIEFYYRDKSSDVVQLTFEQTLRYTLFRVLLRGSLSYTLFSRNMIICNATLDSSNLPKPRTKNNLDIAASSSDVPEGKHDRATMQEGRNRQHWTYFVASLISWKGEDLTKLWCVAEHKAQAIRREIVCTELCKREETNKTKAAYEEKRTWQTATHKDHQETEFTSISSQTNISGFERLKQDTSHRGRLLTSKYKPSTDRNTRHFTQSNQRGDGWRIHLPSEKVLVELDARFAVEICSRQGQYGIGCNQCTARATQCWQLIAKLQWDLQCGLGSVRIAQCKPYQLQHKTPVPSVTLANLFNYVQEMP